MIRTGIVYLTTIPAVAYRQKLASGGSGIVIVKKGQAQAGSASISKTSGEAIPTPNTQLNVYPLAAFAEAMTLTLGMPYRKLGGVKYISNKPQTIEVEEEKALPEEQVVESLEYQTIVATYTDKNDKLSYELLNKDMIKFLNRSKVVKTMIEEMATEKAIRTYIVGAKFRSLTNNSNLSDAQVLKIAKVLDEAYNKGVFKELNEEIRKNLKKSKKK